jgi:chromosome partitioning protein
VRTLTDVLRRSGVRTLAVDLDPQGNLSDYFDLPTDVEPTIADVLTGRSSAAKAIHEDIIPANLSLAEAELALGGKMGRELTLRRALAKLDGDYEVILIDCPPSGADHRRGPVLRAAGSRAGDRGGGPRP